MEVYSLGRDCHFPLISSLLFSPKNITVVYLTAENKNCIPTSHNKANIT